MTYLDGILIELGSANTVVVDSEQRSSGEDSSGDSEGNLLYTLVLEMSVKKTVLIRIFTECNDHIPW